MTKINGKFENVSNINLLTYLKNNNYRVDRVVVEYNGFIIKKINFEEIIIKNEDTIEIVCFVGGG